MNRNNKKYKWLTSCKSGDGAWGFHCKDGHDEWENKLVNKAYVRFVDPTNNAIIYCSYLIITSDDSIEEE